MVLRVELKEKLTYRTVCNAWPAVGKLEMWSALSLRRLCPQSRLSGHYPICLPSVRPRNSQSSLRFGVCLLQLLDYSRQICHEDPLGWDCIRTSQTSDLTLIPLRLSSRFDGSSRHSPARKFLFALENVFCKHCQAYEVLFKTFVVGLLKLLDSLVNRRSNHRCQAPGE